MKECKRCGKAEDIYVVLDYNRAILAGMHRFCLRCFKELMNEEKG